MELKFNIYDKTTDTYYDNKRFWFDISSNLMVSIYKQNTTSEVNIIDCENDIEGIILPYTGLKTGNDEIHLGDLLEDAEHQLWEVIFQDGCFIAENVFIPGRQWIDISMVKVGNKYENKDLMEERKMRYFEFDAKDFDYYGLIGATSEKEAFIFYIENIGEIEEEHKDNKPKEITREEATKITINALNGDVEAKEIEREFEDMSTSKESYLVLIDGALI